VVEALDEPWYERSGAAAVCCGTSLRCSGCVVAGRCGGGLVGRVWVCIWQQDDTQAVGVWERHVQGGVWHKETLMWQLAGNRTRHGGHGAVDCQAQGAVHQPQACCSALRHAADDVPQHFWVGVGEPQQQLQVTWRGIAIACAIRAHRCAGHLGGTDAVACNRNGHLATTGTLVATRTQQRVVDAC
jgi:hypothetical protein